MLEPDSLEQFQQWIGKTDTAIDTVTQTPIAALAATLDHPAEPMVNDKVLGTLWHWLYFLPLARHSELGADGHPEKGGFLPPVPLPRRMWAGSQLEFHHPIHVGDTIERISTIENVTHKSGKSGEMVFVKVKHQINCMHHELQIAGASDARINAITEFHDIVYREPPQADAAPLPGKPAPTTADWQHKMVADDVLLFRYSALTFNAHRIHYDRRYVTDKEGYPGLIVHGPLIATLLIDAMNKELDNPVILQFNFKAIKPLFDINPFYVCGRLRSVDTRDGHAKTRRVELWAKDHAGDIAMQASALIIENHS